MSKARSLADLISGGAVIEASEIADSTITGTKLASNISFQTSGSISFGDAGENISGDGTKLNIASSNDITLDAANEIIFDAGACLLYTSPSPRDNGRSRMPSSA